MADVKDVLGFVLCLGGLNPLCWAACGGPEAGVGVCTTPGENDCIDGYQGEDDGDPFFAGDQFTAYCKNKSLELTNKHYEPDTCADEFILVENTCEHVSEDSNASRPITRYYKCESGCVDGACDPKGKAELIE